MSVFSQSSPRLFSALPLSGSTIHDYIYHITITRGDSLLVGALLAIIIKEKGLHYFNISKSLCALVIGCIIVATLAYINGNFSGKTPLVLMFGLPSLFLIFGADYFADLPTAREAICSNASYPRLS